MQTTLNDIGAEGDQIALFTLAATVANEIRQQHAHE